MRHVVPQMLETISFTVGGPDSISTKDLMEKTHQLPISVMIKERRLRWLGNAARRSDNNMVKQLIFATRIPGHVQPVGWPCGTRMHYATRDVKDMGQQLRYRSAKPRTGTGRKKP